ncbi:MAG: DUF748 domain-containing protein [Vicingaceae bacterium]|jgi:hypothetical protein|nr:DUF748 domain-containing protein [Flavobacteriales bacterium]MBQ20861.1 hypothetical protein [Flavobacteriales bacterium]MDF1676778.1 DUF748 domain-containing protein [Vicingaceae bacterium]|tara:strand:- start:5402 stop:6457 length:1056 start_codon:yes stop_codon:yes gene_type:complete
MAFFSNKTKTIILSIIGLFIIVRLALPYILLKYVNKALSDMDGYHGNVKDLDVALLRGAFTLKGLSIEKENSNIPVPFLKLNEIELSIHWKALMDGAIVGEIIANEPIINFAIDSTGEEAQTGVENNWVQTLRNITPVEVNLNLVTINNAQIYYKDFSHSPIVDIYIKSFNLKATNLSNVVNQTEKLPASIYAQGTSIGGGKLIFAANVNILKPIPDFNADFKLEDANLTSLNSFTEGYANFDFEEGMFSLYSEMIMDNGVYDGYIKPIMTDINLIKKGSDKEKSIFNKGYQLFLDVISEVFENQKHNSFATKSPISGNTNKTKVNVWVTIGNTLKNAFIKALPKKIDKEL